LLSFIWPKLFYNHLFSRLGSMVNWTVIRRVHGLAFHSVYQWSVPAPAVVWQPFESTA